MTILLPIFAFLLAIFFLVTFHEFGHFWVARKFGIKVLRFSVGFGKPIWKRQAKDGTEYVMGWLPLGGYVKLLDAREGNVAEAEKPYEFTGKPLWVRFLVLIAGPVANWILAFILFWLVFLIGIEQYKPIIGSVIPNSLAAQAGLMPRDQILKIDNRDTPTWMRATMALIFRLGEGGKMTVTVLPDQSLNPQTRTINISGWRVDSLQPDPLASLGITPYQPVVPAVIDNVLPNHAAAKAGLQQGDKILAIDNQTIKDWPAMIKYVKAQPGQQVSILVQRGDQKITLPATIETKTKLHFKPEGFLGMTAQPVEMPAFLKFKRHYSLLSAWRSAWQETILFSQFNFVVLGKMLIGRVSMQGLGGPITIFSGAKNAFAHGVVIYLSFLALLSVMLATINILPVPGLDGGHILLLVIEAVKGRPLSIAAQTLILRLGFIFLLIIMFQATINDLLRL